MSNEPKGSKLFGTAHEAMTKNHIGATLPANGDIDFWGDSFANPQQEFWKYEYADNIKTNWSKLFPYQFLVLKADGTGTYSNKSIVATFTLPIPPEDLSITTPYAINTAVTMGGFFEEHNAAPIRGIGLSGTTGLLPLKGTAQKITPFNPSLAIVSGAVTGNIAGAGAAAASAAETAVGQAKNLIGDIASPSATNVVSERELTGGGYDKSSGYYQFLLLQRFLESYVFRKTQPDGQNLRLAFAIWKEQAIYLVTPSTFEVRRSASSPLEYRYSIQLKAWRRVVFKDAHGSYGGSTGAASSNPAKLFHILNALDGARQVVSAGLNSLRSVRSDINLVVMTPMRQVILLVKDITGAGLTIRDLPENLLAQLREPLLESGILVNRGGGLQISNPFSADVGKMKQALNESGTESNKNEARGGRTGSNLGSNADPFLKILNDPQNSSILDIAISALHLRPHLINSIEAERERVRQFKREDFERFRNDTLRVLADFSDFVGAGNDTYTELYGLPQRTTNDMPTDSDWEIIHTLSNIAQQYDALSVDVKTNVNTLESMDFVAGLAQRAGIAFKTSASKFAVPFPYGYTLEQLSERYLGTPDRWHEIATLNGLQVPYVDETGFQLSLLSNGLGRTVRVPVSPNLFVGQKVWLSSQSAKREARRIQGITPMPGHLIVQLDGASDLEKFTLSSHAILQAFLPNTVNSQMQLFIPSPNAPEENEFFTKKIPGVDYFDPLIKSGGIDLLLTSDGDLVFTPDGDNKLAVGLTNLVQKTRLAIGTPKGSLLHHPGYGLNLRPGVSTAELDAQTIVTDAKNLFKDDPSISGVQAVHVNKDGNTMKIILSIGIAGTSQFVPVSVLVRR